MSDDVVSRAKAACPAAPQSCMRCTSRLAALVPELVVEVERLRADLAAVPSAIAAYADAELTSVSYESGEPDATEAMKFALGVLRETLRRVQRNAENIVAYAATARPVDGDPK